MSRRDDDLPISVDAQEIIGAPEAAVHAAVSLELLPRQGGQSGSRAKRLDLKVKKAPAAVVTLGILAREHQEKSAHSLVRRQALDTTVAVDMEKWRMVEGCQSFNAPRFCGARVRWKNLSMSAII
jgi:hypothetical protein